MSLDLNASQFRNMEYIITLTTPQQLQPMSARVPASVKYSDEVVAWNGTPAEVEDVFRKSVGHFVKDDYLNFFETHLRRLHAEAKNTGLSNLISSVAYTQVYFYPHMRRIVYATTFVRPCAEGLGFFRLMLCQLARVAYFYGFDLHVDSPFERTQSILERSFGQRPLQRFAQEETYIGGRRAGYMTKRFVLAHAELGGAVEKLNCKHFLIEADGADDDDFKFIDMRLQHTAFPLAKDLNEEVLLID